MEIFGIGKVLADQGRADHLAVLLDQAAIGLVRKGQLRDAGHAERIDQTGDDRHHDNHHDGGADFFEPLEGKSSSVRQDRLRSRPYRSV